MSSPVTERRATCREDGGSYVVSCPFCETTIRFVLEYGGSLASYRSTCPHVYALKRDAGMHVHFRS